MGNRMQHPLETYIEEFLSELHHANRSVHTLRAYQSDLENFAGVHSESIQAITADSLRTFFNQHNHLTPASRSRKQASIASFLKWAQQHDLIHDNPMQRINRVRLEPPTPRAIPRAQVEQVLASIPKTHLRDYLLFRLIFETGLRISEALGVYLEDMDLIPDDERIRVTGKGQRQRTLLLDDPELVHKLKQYLRRMGYKHGPLFRAQKNGRGGPLRYQSAQELWAKYCKLAGIQCSLHQLRHSHATELVNDGVSLATIRKRLGHQNMQTTLRYAEQADATADAELRARRRKQNRAELR